MNHQIAQSDVNKVKIENSSKSIKVSDFLINQDNSKTPIFFPMLDRDYLKSDTKQNKQSAFYP